MNRVLWSAQPKVRHLYHSHPEKLRDHHGRWDRKIDCENVGEDVGEDFSEIVSSAGRGHCSHKLTTAVVSYVWPVQEPASQHSGMDRRGTRKVISPCEVLLEIDSCGVEGESKVILFSGVRHLIGFQCSDEWSHTYVHAGIINCTHWGLKEEDMTLKDDVESAIRRWVLSKYIYTHPQRINKSIMH